MPALLLTDNLEMRPRARGGTRSYRRPRYVVAEPLNYCSTARRGNTLQAPVVFDDISPEFPASMNTPLRSSRREWLAVVHGLMSGLMVMVAFALSGCVVTARPRGAVVRTAPPPPPPPPTVVVAETTRRGTAIVITEAPPPPRREIIVERERPSGAHVWIRGYWHHDGRGYLWVPGHWERPPRAQVVWVEPRWERRGGTYVFIEGSWR